MGSMLPSDIKDEILTFTVKNPPVQEYAHWFTTPVMSVRTNPPVILIPTTASKPKR